jgi:hypothetical protein
LNENAIKIINAGNSNGTIDLSSNNLLDKRNSLHVIDECIEKESNQNTINNVDDDIFNFDLNLKRSE